MCDGDFFRDQPVTVIGGGNSAFGGIAVSDAVCQRGSHRDPPRRLLRAEPIIQQAIEQNPKIEIIRSHVPVEILEQDGKVGGIVLKNVHDGK